MKLEEYVKQNLSNVLKSIIETERVSKLQNLSVYEKAIIFTYTDTSSKH